MLLRNFLILFFGLPAAALHGIACVACPQLDWGSQHLYCRNIQHLSVRRCKAFIKYATTLLFIICIAQNTTAQDDSNYVDTISLKHAKPPTAASDTVVTDNDTAGYGYDDQDDGYVDTTVKHIYDTSKYFFNWKSYYQDAFVTEKIKPRHLLDSMVNALKNDDDFWYIPAIEKLETRLKNDPKFRDSLLKARNRDLLDERQHGLLYQSWFNILLWVLIIGIFAAAVVYFLMQHKINIFSRESVSSAEDTGESEQEDIFNLSYIKLIQKAEKEKDNRLAIRLMFLQTLKLLSDTGNIQYQPDYTDLHYLQQLHETKYYNEFFNVMRSYEYAWYGKFYISPERYATIKNDFNKLQNKIM